MKKDEIWFFFVKFLNQIFFIKLKMVCFIGVIYIILISILMNNPCLTEWLLHQFLQNRNQIEIEKNRGPTWHFWKKKSKKNVINILTFQNFGWRSATVYSVNLRKTFYYQNNSIYTEKWKYFFFVNDIIYYEEIKCY